MRKIVNAWTHWGGGERSECIEWEHARPEDAFAFLGICAFQASLILLSMIQALQRKLEYCKWFKLKTLYILLHCGLLIVNIRTLIRHGKRKPDRLKKKPMTRVWCGNRDLPSRYTGTRGTDNRQPVRIIIRPLRSLFHNHDQDATTDLPRKFETEEFSWTGILEGSQILKESFDVFKAPLFWPIDPKPKAK